MTAEKRNDMPPLKKLKVLRTVAEVRAVRKEKQQMQSQQQQLLLTNTNTNKIGMY